MIYANLLSNFKLNKVNCVVVDRRFSRINKMPLSKWLEEREIVLFGLLDVLAFD